MLAIERLGLLGRRKRRTNWLAFGAPALGSVVLGSLATFFFAPSQGKARRDWLWNKAVGQASRAKVRVSRSVHDLGQQGMPLAREAQAADPDAHVTDGEILERIRAIVGRLVQNGAGVQLRSDNGRVELSGHVRRDELTSLLSAVRSVRGVKDVENKLELDGNIVARA